MSQGMAPVLLTLNSYSIMAKGNMLQGMARGKVGDVVFSRLNGEQISRVRNRHPKNPRSNAQLYQRAIMATVMRAYSAGMVIFDHAFEGKAVGAENQRRFMALNAKLLRSQIAADINGEVAVASQVGRVVAPGVQSPTPAALQVSEGSLVNVLMSGTVPAAASQTETVAQYCARLGLVSGDLFTFVAFGVDGSAGAIFELLSDSTKYSKQFSTSFYFARYAVKASALTDTTVVANLGQILELSDANYSVDVNIAQILVGEDVPNLAGMFTSIVSGSFGWIRSRLNEDLRSSCQLEIVSPSDNDAFGIASQFVLDAWKQGATNLGDSDLILEGGDE